MAEAARAGSVYKLDLRDGKPGHYWIVLNDPSPTDGRFIAVSWTDRHNAPLVSDVWPYGMTIRSGIRLSKPSALALQYAVVRTQEWLDHFEALHMGMCEASVLTRARCNLYWFGKLLNATVARVAAKYASEWRDPCGPAPSHSPRPC